jgi:hypothetical protein
VYSNMGADKTATAGDENVQGVRLLFCFLLPGKQSRVT